MYTCPLGWFVLASVFVSKIYQTVQYFSLNLLNKTILYNIPLMPRRSVHLHMSTDLSYFSPEYVPFHLSFTLYSLCACLCNMYTYLLQYPHKLFPRVYYKKLYLQYAHLQVLVFIIIANIFSGYVYIWYCMHQMYI